MPVSVFLLMSRSALQTGGSKSQFESAQKATTVGANWETFGFDSGEDAECTAILMVLVEEIETRKKNRVPRSSCGGISPVVMPRIDRASSAPRPHSLATAVSGMLDRPIMTVACMVTT